MCVLIIYLWTIICILIVLLLQDTLMVFTRWPKHFGKEQRCVIGHIYKSTFVGSLYRCMWYALMHGHGTHKVQALSYLWRPRSECLSARKFKYSIDINVSSDFLDGCLTFDRNKKGNINPKSSSALKFIISRPKSVFHWSIKQNVC